MEYIESYKMYRLVNNPKEKEFVEKFTQQHTNDNGIDAIVFGTVDGLKQETFLTESEKRIVMSTIQWLGSPVGQGFLNECGFKKTD